MLWQLPPAERGRRGNPMVRHDANLHRQLRCIKMPSALHGRKRGRRDGRADRVGPTNFRWQVHGQFDAASNCFRSCRSHRADTPANAGDQQPNTQASPQQIDLRRTRTNSSLHRASSLTLPRYDPRLNRAALRGQPAAPLFLYPQAILRPRFIGARGPGLSNALRMQLSKPTQSTRLRLRAALRLH